MTVIVVVATPLFRTVVGPALMPALAANGGMKSTVGFCASTTAPPEAVAVNVTDSKDRFVTLKIAAPSAALVTGEIGVITAWLPALAASATVEPEMRLPLASVR